MSHKEYGVKDKIQLYGFAGTVRLAISFIYTRLFFSRSRLIRLPIDIRGKKYVDFGENLTTGVGCRIEAFPLQKSDKIIKFGNNIEINDYVHIAGLDSVSIGNNVLIASKVYISDIQHGNYSGVEYAQDNPESTPNTRRLYSKPVIIEDNVWIGEGVSIMPGVTIGKGAIIGAGSVVTKKLPPNCIAAGNPAKIIKMYNVGECTWEKP